MVQREEADSLICGTFGQYLWHLNYVQQVLGTETLHPVGSMSLMILEQGPLFIADTHIHAQPTPQQVMENVIAAARHVRRFGLPPKIALCSGSQFGNHPTSPSGRIAREALAMLDAADLGWTPRAAPDTAIAEVQLCTRRLGRLTRFEAADSEAATMIAQWRETGSDTGQMT